MIILNVVIDTVSHSTSGQVDGEEFEQVPLRLHNSLGEHVSVGLVRSIRCLLVRVVVEAGSLVLVHAELTTEESPLSGLVQLLEGEVVSRVKKRHSSAFYKILVEEL